ncbi:MAG: cell division protein FtsH, partial [Corynebacterium glyciniphilum]|nr:cell division protein FtsH [Corynebacterium glyciniphilum]
YSPAVAATIDDQVRMLIEKAHGVAYRILRDNRDYLDRLAEKLLEKETLRRPDLEAIFEDMEPVEVSDIFPNQDIDHPKDFREPVKTPTELARERGEELPARNDFFSEARKARIERRRRQQADELEQKQDHPQAARTPGRWSGQSHPDHLWGGQDRVNPDEPGRHPGESSYGTSGDAGSTESAADQPLRGFRLPDSEQPDNPWTSDDAPTRNLRAQNSGQHDGGRHHRPDDSDEKD